MTRRFRPSAAAACSLAAFALLAGARPAAAQRVQLAPTIGVYIPTQTLYHSLSTGAEVKPEASLTLGGRLGVWLGNRLGLEATGDYAPGKLKFTTAGQSKVDANTFTGSGRMTFFVIPNTSPIYFSVSGGVGYVKRSGEYYKNNDNPITGQPYADDELKDWTGTAGARVGFHLGRLLHLSVGAEDYIYKPNVAETATNVETRTQHDVHLNFGVGIPLLGLGS
jgi:hypothetical protein